LAALERKGMKKKENFSCERLNGDCFLQSPVAHCLDMTSRRELCLELTIKTKKDQPDALLLIQSCS
jgi:hypothetical protein